MNTEKRRRGRPHKREEDKLIGRRVSMVQNNWDIIDDFLDYQDMDLNDLFEYLSIAIAVATSREEEEVYEN